MDKKTQESFDEILQDSENKTCFECNVPSNQWASVNNGIFLCLSCSGLHRGFGVHVSFVRSVTMDAWSDKQIEMMKIGGNKRLREFFDEYKMPKDAPIDFKYKTRAAVWYRENLKAEVEGREPEPKPTLEEGFEQIQTKNPNFNSNMQSFGFLVWICSNPSSRVGFEQIQTKNPNFNSNMQSFGSTSIQSKPESKMGSFFASINKFGVDALEATKNAAQKVNDKVKDAHVKEGIVSFGSSVYDKTKEIGHKAVDGTKAAVDNVKTKTEEKGGVLNYAKFVGESGVSSAKKGFDSAWSFIKKKTGQQKEGEPQQPASEEEKQQQ